MIYEDKYSTLITTIADYLFSVFFAVKYVTASLIRPKEKSVWNYLRQPPLFKVTRLN